MIIEPFESKKYSIDVGRPDIFNDVDRQFWREFFDLVETIDIPIVVNSVYQKMRDIAFSDDGGYGGGGFSFKFWFQTVDDRKKFALALEEKLDTTCAYYNHFTLHFDPDKNLQLRFHHDIADVVSQFPGFGELQINDYYTKLITGERKPTEYMIASSNPVVMVKLHFYLRNRILDCNLEDI